jgi:ubiquinol-cytochrome c reductase cytochrome c1 subunit
MLRKTFVLAAALGLAIAGPAMAAGGALHPKEINWTFNGPLGTFDQGQLQRGFKVYQ